MVGVPGRSKGCNTCIQRRIKCDQGQPTCGNCHKSKRICGGYTRKTIYIFSEDVHLKQQDVQADDRTVVYHGRAKVSDRQAKFSTNDKSGSLASKNLLLWSGPSPTPSSGTSSPPHRSDVEHRLDLLAAGRFTNVSINWHQLHHIFLSTYMPRAGIGTTSKSGTQVDGNWLLQLQGGVINSPVLQTSVAAYAAAHLAHERNNQALVRQSREMYMRSLEHLRIALSKKRTRLSDETLAACLALSMYELAESPTAGVNGGENSSMAANGYTTHLMGAMMLMEMRGPDMNNSPLAHSLFLGLRRYMLLGSLMNHKDTFISHPQWRERPWAVYPKNLLDVCLDALFEMPAVLRQWDDVSHESNDVVIQHKCAAILDRCNELDADLQSWYVEYEQSWSGPLYQTAFCTLESQFDNEELGKVFPISYHFPAFTVGYVLITYWSGLMVVHNIAMAAQYKLAYVASISPAGTLSACAAAKEHTDIWLDMVRNMCQSVEYFMGEETGRIGPTTAMGIMQGCMASLSGGPEPRGREQGWVMEMMGRIGKRLNLPRHDVLWK